MFHVLLDVISLAIFVKVLPKGLDSAIIIILFTKSLDLVDFAIYTVHRDELEFSQ